MRSYTVITTLLLGVSALSLSACSHLVDKHVEWERIEPQTYPVLNAVGYAPIASQRGQTDGQRMLLAMKASKLDAYRELAEQVYGQRIDGELSVANLVVEDARLQSSVQGVIRGAEVVKTYAIGEDTYVTELKLDMQKVYDIYLTTAKPKRIKAVKYY
ncbi:flagellar biosynthesis protein FlgP [Alteromonas aestuariivivens]|uniref:Flagellar biosynthesis protein FlgP n=1 Tax=Alteromonas aestuariivivens TaxID=1938339 RepID=A0A3D8M5Y3_9ALTE|nr:LPP20 family lipoprotein [Alteromonas aestuariivivens]RDV25018.1 flagellar biosynthesis protein FlgP [Alteromonas aestuariivivens]